MRTSIVSAAKMRAGLHRLGVAAGDALVVHSSLSSFGYVPGGAKTLLYALLDAVGSTGTLMVPTMTFGRCSLPNPSPEPFDPARTPCDRSMGVLSETLRRYPDARRSSHPLVSVAALGPLAERLVEAQTLDEPYAPYRVLAELGGKVLLLGVGHTRNSTVHAAEYLAGLPYATGQAALPWYALVSTPSGSAVVILRSIAGCSEGFHRLDHYVPERRELIGSCQARLMWGRDVIAAALTLFRSEPAPFLCSDPTCLWCHRLRTRHGP